VTPSFNVTPYGFWRNGSHFLAARKALRLAEFSLVPYYLSCMSIELLLKAYLLAKGVSMDHIKGKIEHKLPRALREAQQLGLGDHVEITPAIIKTLDDADAYYRMRPWSDPISGDSGRDVRSLQYFSAHLAAQGYPGLPDPDVLDAFAEELAEKLKPICRAAV
jgi:hypothetical protein